jgi:hypothetical protein
MSDFDCVFTRSAQVVVVALGSVIFNIPRFFNNYAVTLPDGSSSLLLVTNVGANATFQILYAGVLYYLVIYAMPFVSLIWMTYRLISSLHQFYARREQVTNVRRAENDLTKTLIEHNSFLRWGHTQSIDYVPERPGSVTKTLIVVVLVFMVCQVLNPIRRFLVVVLPSTSQSCGSFFFYFSGVSTVSITVESSVHFFIYNLCNRHFRKKLRSKLGRLGVVAIRCSGRTAVSPLPLGLDAAVSDQPLNLTLANPAQPDDNRYRLNRTGTEFNSVAEAAHSS